MQLFSLKNGGLLKYEETENNLAEQLSYEIDEDVDNIQVTLSFLKANKLIEEIEDNEFLLTKATECIGKECDSAERVRKFRERKEAKALQCNNEVTNCNTEIEIRDKKEDKREKIEDIDNSISKDILSSNDIKTIIATWNSLGLNKLSNIRAGSKRHIMLKARINEYGIDAILEAINNIKDSSFLRGQNNRNWIVVFDWLIKPNNFPKVLEGNYTDKNKKNTNSSKSDEDILKQRSNELLDILG